MKQILDTKGRILKFGRKPFPKKGRPRLLARDFLRLAAIPTPPSECTYANDSDRASLSAVMLNSSLGDCVIAGGYHVVGVETGNAGQLFLPTDEQIIADYSAIGGYVPNQPNTDQGCNEQDALDYWQNHGFANGTKIAGSLVVDAANADEVKACVYLFGNVIFGVALPDAWISPFPGTDGFTWSVAGDPDYSNGHCFVGVGYGTSGVQIDTWGMLGTVTWDAVAKYAVANAGGELHCALTPDQIIAAQGKAPNGVAWRDLVAAFDALGGTVAVPVDPPSPDPTPTPTPTPNPDPTPVPPDPVPVPSTVTLEQATEWATSHLRGGHAQRHPSWSEARELVGKGLTKNWPA